MSAEIVVRLEVNGEERAVAVKPGTTLLTLLRNHLNLTGTNKGCEAGDCGACTVLVDGHPLPSCITLAVEVEGKKVVTIEGLANGDRLHAIQQAFVDHLAYQCGYCTPGMIMGAYALLLKNPKAARADIVKELDAHLCRCGAHVRILKAVESAATTMKGGVR